MKKILILMFLAPLTLAAQEKGVHFLQDELSWKQVQEKAKAEHKYIFVDVSTSSCPACVYLNKKIFPQQEVGDYMNSHFLCVEAPMYQAQNGSLKVESWRWDGDLIGATYKVTGWPTLLVFAPDGKVVDRYLGAPDARALVKWAEQSQDPSKQYYTLLEKVANGAKDSTTLVDAATAAVRAMDWKSGNEIVEKYMSTQKNPFTGFNLSFMSYFVKSSTSYTFQMFWKNREKIDAMMGANYAENKLAGVITREEIDPRVYKRIPDDWKAIQDTVDQKYPGFGAEAVSKAKIEFYEYKEQWDKYVEAIVSYVNNFRKQVSDEDLNNYAFDVFEHSKDEAVLAQAQGWSKRALDAHQNIPAFMDTYANFLYRAGKKDEAIALETKAAAMDKRLQPTLDKMNKAEKTWE